MGIDHQDIPAKILLASPAYFHQEPPSQQNSHLSTNVKNYILQDLRLQLIHNMASHPAYYYVSNCHYYPQTKLQKTLNKCPTSICT